jgi:MFS family permease
MPDLTHESLRSKANGVINLMGGTGSIIAYFVGSKLYLKNPGYPFYMASILIIICIVILYFNIKEERDSLNYNAVVLPKEKRTEEKGARLFSKENINILKLLAAIFFWFTAFNGVETFFTRYGQQYLGVNEAVAAGKFTFYSLAVVVFAIPAGIIASKIGKKKTITIGLCSIIVLFGGLFFTINIDIIGYMFIFAGICAALIHINSYPFVVSMTTGSSIGKFTGYYYLASSLANIVSPPLLGALIDWLGYGILFKYAVVGFILALLCLLTVKAPKEDGGKRSGNLETLDNLDV